MRRRRNSFLFKSAVALNTHRRSRPWRTVAAPPFHRLRRRSRRRVKQGRGDVVRRGEHLVQGFRRARTNAGQAPDTRRLNDDNGAFCVPVVGRPFAQGQQGLKGTEGDAKVAPGAPLGGDGDHGLNHGVEAAPPLFTPRTPPQAEGLKDARTRALHGR